MKKVTAMFMLMLSLALVFSVSTFAVTNAQAKASQTMSAKNAKSSMSQVVQKININSADAEALTRVSGIGPKKAETIISYRKANGKFKTIDDLLNVKGIGPKTLEKIKANLTI